MTLPDATQYAQCLYSSAAAVRCRHLFHSLCNIVSSNGCDMSAGTGWDVRPRVQLLPIWGSPLPTSSAAGPVTWAPVGVSFAVARAGLGAA